jgi:hypothetical protein
LSSRSQEESAARSAAADPLVVKLETVSSAIGGDHDSTVQVVGGLVAAGVEFTGGRMPDVRLRKGMP